MSKGSKRRPLKTDPEQFAANWARIFEKAKEELLEQEEPEEAEQRRQHAERKETGTKHRRVP